MSGDLEAIVLIVALGLGTYATRIGGHLVLSRFDRLNPRLEAALDSVPAAVMTALVAPLTLAAGIAEAAAAAVTIWASLHLPIHAVLVIGAVLVVALRAIGL